MATINGGTGNDSLLGTAAADQINGFGGNDTINGLGGADTINAGDGNDLIQDLDGVTDIVNAGSGNDTFVSSSTPIGGSDQVFLQDGDDLAFLGWITVGTNETVDGGAGSDTFNYSNFATLAVNVDIQDNGTLNFLGTLSANNVYLNFENVTGNTVANTILGSSANNILDGAGGNDSLNGEGGNDTIFGGSGADNIVGGAGLDLIYGDDSAGGGAPGNDTIQGGTGADTIFGQGGADSLSGGNQDDSIDGGDGNDLIDGGGGSDTILGGLGNDSITDTDGSNLIDGGDGADTIFVTGATVQNSVLGGAGNDSITVFDSAASTNEVDGGSGADTITTGDSTDSIFGGGNNDSIDAGANSDFIDGQAGFDTLIGFTGNDTILGGDGDDVIFAGADNDSIDGGDGSETIDGGTGNDTQTGGQGFDVFLVSAGNDIITDFGTFTGGDIGDGNQANNDFLDLAPYYENLFEARADLADDGLLNQSNTTDTKGRAVDYSNNTALPGTISIGAAATGFTFDTVNLTCFVRGTRIATPGGEVAVEEIGVGDLVTTLDNGPLPVRWVGHRAVPRGGRFAPVRIRKGALGNRRDLLVSPQHRILLGGWRAELLFGEPEVLVPAKHLVDGERIVADGGPGKVEYFPLLFDAHEIVLSEGVPSESFHPGEAGLNGMAEDARDELLALFPELADPGVVAHLPSARPSLRSFEAGLLRV